MKLFWRIFFSFWIAMLMMTGLVVVVNELLPMTFPGDRRTRFEPEHAQSALTAAMNDYEAHGREALALDLQEFELARRRSTFVFDEDGNMVFGHGRPPIFYQPLAREVLNTGRPEIQGYFGLRLLFICPVQSASGKRYAVVLTAFEPARRLSNLRFWFDVLLALVPAALVCMGLSLYITRPITRLRSTAQRLAGGDLGARANAPGAKRSDELGELARDFDSMAAQIQSLMAAQRRFVADVSHELGAPLTRLHLALALLERRSGSDQSAELERIRRETETLSELVQQLLLLARLEAGSRPVETREEISIKALCESVIEDAGFEAEQIDRRVTGSRQDAALKAYPLLLRRAIDNVLRNAIRHSSPGSEIEFNCTADKEHHRVVVEIMDRGPGVPEAMLAEIFQPFVRTAPGRESGSGGTGLGLAIATEAVRLHGGSINARNRAGGGLAVTIALPLDDLLRPLELAPS
jgi:two-component system, OmpR family, sensor histidine kinase CpxA